MRRPNSIYGNNPFRCFFARLCSFASLRQGFGMCLVVVVSCAALARGADPWLVLKGGDGPGHGKRVVLISGDEEYRSEEALPQLARILSARHGFDCTVLFAIDPKEGGTKPMI